MNREEYRVFDELWKATSDMVTKLQLLCASKLMPQTWEQDIDRLITALTKARPLLEKTMLKTGRPLWEVFGDD